MKKHLKVLNLKVLASGKFVYDQDFHSGLNVLAGANGTGKSSIIDFMVYALGYEEIEWKSAQKKCDYVELLVELDSRKYLLRREINSLRMNSVYFKDYGSAGNWTVLPYKNSSDKKSFSHFLFDLLGFPDVKVADASALTMFQILRLVYANQTTSADSLFNRQKDMDNKGLRKSVYEFLLGIDDLESHRLRQELLQLDKSYSALSGEIGAIKGFLKSRGDGLSKDDIDRKILSLRDLIDRETALIPSVKSKASLDEVDSIMTRLDKLTYEQHELNSDREALSLQISDSRELIGLLEGSTSEIGESLAFYAIFSGMEYLYCPQCLSSIAHSSDAGVCNLCKNSKVGDEKVSSFYFERKKEIEFQIIESNANITNKLAKIAEIDLKLERGRALAASLRMKRSVITQINDEQVRAISTRGISIGSWLEEVTHLERDLALSAQLMEKEGFLVSYKERIASLKERLSLLEEGREIYKEKVLAIVSEMAVRILRADGGYEEAFDTAKEVILLFEDSKMVVDGATKFSDSSDAVLKLASRFAIFASSLMEPRVRIPNFGIIDCMEDKGMRPERAHVIQDAILDELAEFNPNSFQLILATSMPSERILDKRYIVGRFLVKGEHTLNFEGIEHSDSLEDEGLAAE